MLVIGELVIAGLLATNHGSENDNALLTFADITPHPKPRLKAGNMRRIRALAVDQKDVAPTIAVKAGHDGQVLLEGLTVTLLESFHQPSESGFAERLGLIGIHVAPPVGRASAVTRPLLAPRRRWADPASRVAGYELR